MRLVSVHIQGPRGGGGGGGGYLYLFNGDYKPVKPPTKTETAPK